MSYSCAHQSSRPRHIHVPTSLPAHVTFMCPPGFPPTSHSCAHQSSRPRHIHAPTSLPAHVTFMRPPVFPPTSHSCAHQSSRPRHIHVPTSLPAHVTFMCPNQGTSLQEYVKEEAQLNYIDENLDHFALFCKDIAKNCLKMRKLPPFKDSDCTFSARVKLNTK